MLLCSEPLRKGKRGLMLLKILESTCTSKSNILTVSLLPPLPLTDTNE